MTSDTPARSGRQPSPIVGRNIRSLRELQRMSQTDLASFIRGIDQSAVARIEQGKRTVSIEEAQEIATALGATVLDLLSDVGESGDRLFYARVMRPMQQIEAAMATSDRALDGYRDRSLREAVERLSEGLADYSASAMDPAALVEDGQPMGQTLTLARALLDRYEAFETALQSAFAALSAPMAAPESTRGRAREQARKVSRRN